ncbi:serine protease inhibitor 42Dd isoform X2 [Ceratitis capitata]|uniref:(Mediterranean fruit fly) hypothetical protein n=1 Tax=Ceratitis capitata TaxID=7213 RepID=A0A811VJJ1_CERCA|nr:serine protease inhibitor 42Dd isoform X2 [Ceratitis capitata]CAD7014303.1 unnamed protein product [Ceratitis capitata]
MTSARFYFLAAQILFAANHIIMAAAGTIAPSLSASHNLFASDIYQKIALKRSEENVVFSPASIQSCLALAFLGAEGETAQQMRHGLRLPVALEKTSIADDYAGFLQKNFRTGAGLTEDTPKLRMANRIYVNEALQLSPAFNNLAKTSFGSEALPTKFAESAKAADAINKWVANETENKIQNLLQPDAVNADTSAILVNAIYFKAKWLKPFSKFSTTEQEFRMGDGQTQMVPMMYADEHLKYGELTDLKAKALELPYKGSDLSMLILLPNKIDGLSALEKKLANVDFNQITERLQSHSVDVSLPKFRIEFNIDLKEPLQQLGMSNMFQDTANFNSLFVGGSRQKVNDVKHKAFLDVNEAGSEAAAATFMKMVPMSLNLDQKSFRADHPFVFAIRNKEAVYFVGHVAKL